MSMCLAVLSKTEMPYYCWESRCGLLKLIFASLEIFSKIIVHKKYTILYSRTVLDSVYLLLYHILLIKILWTDSSENTLLTYRYLYTGLSIIEI